MNHVVNVALVQIISVKNQTAAQIQIAVQVNIALTVEVVSQDVLEMMHVVLVVPVLIISV